MKRLRFLVATLIAWLFLFYNIERLSAPINITDVAYTFVPFVAALTILVPRLRKVPLGVLLVAPIPVFLVLKAWWKSRVWGASLPLTVTEICVIVVTILLAHWVSNEVSEFESVLAHITIGQTVELPEQFLAGQTEMYQELRRARHHNRPLALMAIGIEKESIRVALDRMVQEVQQTMMKRYVLADVSRALCDELEGYNIIARRNDHFLVLLPEITSEEVTDLVSSLHETVSEQVGVALQIGTASFPDDAVTFDSLVEMAVGEMEGEREPAYSPQSQRLTA